MASKFKFIFDKVSKETLNKIDQALNPSFMKKVGESLADDIVRRTRLGYGVPENSDKREKLAPLKESTKQNRKRNKNKMTGPTNANKSNLTFSGQLLDSLTTKSKEKKTFTIEFKGNHRNLDGSTLKNSDLARFMADGDLRKNRPKRAFLGPSQRERQRVIDLINKKIINDLKK